jgi:hypothetical protein
MKLWDKKLDKDGVKVYIKKGGSKLNKDFPYLISTTEFNAYYPMYKLVESVLQFEVTT